MFQNLSSYILKNQNFIFGSFSLEYIKVCIPVYRICMIIINLYNLIYKIYNECPEVNNLKTCNYIFDIYNILVNINW